jgi:hypothetical protein
MSPSQEDPIRSPLDELATPLGDPLHPAKLKAAPAGYVAKQKRWVRNNNG